MKESRTKTSTLIDVLSSRKARIAKTGLGILATAAGGVSPVVGSAQAQPNAGVEARVASDPQLQAKFQNSLAGLVLGARKLKGNAPITSTVTTGNVQKTHICVPESSPDGKTLFNLDITLKKPKDNHSFKFKPKYVEKVVVESESTTTTSPDIHTKEIVIKRKGDTWSASLATSDAPPKTSTTTSGPIIGTADSHEIKVPLNMSTFQEVHGIEKQAEAMEEAMIVAASEVTKS